MVINEKAQYDALQREHHKFAEALNDPKGNMRPQTVSVSSNDATSISRMLESPESNYTQITGLMNVLARKNGTVGRVINYLAAHTPYNYTIFAALNDKSGLSGMSVTVEDYLAAANQIDKYKVKLFAPYFVRQVLIQGMAFFYEIADSKGVSYMEFPVSWGRISSQKDGVYRWELDVSKLKDELMPYMPKEIQTAYEQQKTGSTTDEKKWRENKFYRLSDKAVAFCIDQSVMMNGGIAVSEFASLLIDSVKLEKAKDNVDIKDDIDTIRIVHAKIPLTKENKPAFGSNTAKEYDGALKRALPKGVVGITNPMELTNVPLNGSGNSKSYEIVDKTSKQLFMSTGVPSSLFGSETTSSNIVKLSIQKDAAWVYTKILPMLDNYYTSVLASVKSTSNVTWKARFLRISNFTLKEDIGLLKDAVSFGGSRTDYLASLGAEPVEIYNKLVMEQQVLNIDSIMLPKQTSFTMGSSDANGKTAGRPNTDEPTDDTDRLNDAS